ncbi:MAG: hypothetical protein Q7R85_03205 [bacterium]|nr:hypothetical protein [bacterium]
MNSTMVFLAAVTLGTGEWAVAVVLVLVAVLLGFLIAKGVKVFKASVGTWDTMLTSAMLVLALVGTLSAGAWLLCRTKPELTKLLEAVSSATAPAPAESVPAGK